MVSQDLALAVRDQDHERRACRRCRCRVLGIGGLLGEGRRCLGEKRSGMDRNRLG